MTCFDITDPQFTYQIAHSVWCCMTMAYEPATDNSSCSADPTPAVNIGNFTLRKILAITGKSMENGAYFGEVVFTGGHEQTIVAVNNGDVDGGVTWADGLGNWEDGYNSGALRKAVDAGLVDMNDLVEIWRSKPIPEGPIVLRKALPERVKLDVVSLTASLKALDPECAYNFMAGESLGVMPINHDAYLSIIEARKSKM